MPTEAEWDAACREMPNGTTCGDCRKTLARAALQKVVRKFQDSELLISKQICSGSFRPEDAIRIRLSREAWQSLLKEAGLENK